MPDPSSSNHYSLEADSFSSRHWQNYIADSINMRENDNYHQKASIEFERV